MTLETETKFEEWAIVDVMGHQRYVGKVTEQVIAGCGFVRVDIPKTETTQAWTKLVGTGSIYAITPVSEDITRAMAARSQKDPVQAFELTPKLIRDSTQQRMFDDDEFDDDEPL